MLINFGCSGCLLPLLILFNLFFGWIFIHSFLLWLMIQTGLVLLFLFNSYLVIKHFSGSPANKGKESAIDVEAEVVEEKKKLK